MIVLLWPAAFATADADDGKAPSAWTDAATEVGDRTVTLNGRVRDNRSTTSFRFEYGVTTSYGQSTTESKLTSSETTRTVSAAIAGLAPGTVYHFRVRAWNSKGTTVGGDQSFTTTGSATAPSTDPGVSANTSQPSVEDIPQSTAASKPVLGGSVVVAPMVGTVKIKLPGSAGYARLAAGDSVPVGTVVDTRQGTVKLTSALRGGTTQSGEFRGGLFQVRQASTGNGMTDLVLRGSNFAICPRPTAGPGVRAASTTSSKRPLRRLWSRDKGGRFRTHGRNSVATVRGTSWVTTDTCAGTRTTVKEGSVAVRNKRLGKTVLVRAGKTYLARGAH